MIHLIAPSLPILSIALTLVLSQHQIRESVQNLVLIPLILQDLVPTRQIFRNLHPKLKAGTFGRIVDRTVRRQKPFRLVCQIRSRIQQTLGTPVQI